MKKHQRAYSESFITQQPTNLPGEEVRQQDAKFTSSKKKKIATGVYQAELNTTRSSQGICVIILCSCINLSKIHSSLILNRANFIFSSLKFCCFVEKILNQKHQIKSLQLKVSRFYHAFDLKFFPLQQNFRVKIKLTD